MMPTTGEGLLPWVSGHSTTSDGTQTDKKLVNRSFETSGAHDDNTLYHFMMGKLGNA